MLTFKNSIYMEYLIFNGEVQVLAQQVFKDSAGTAIRLTDAQSAVRVVTLYDVSAQQIS
jgi:hypothetical protein